MSRFFTIQKLIQRGRQRCDQENRDILSAAEWQAELSTVWGEFRGIIVESGTRYFESSETFDTVSGQRDYPLPTDYMATIGVDYDGTDDISYELPELLAQERNLYRTGAGSRPAAYALIGQNIRLYPTPSTVETFTHVYAPQAPDISEATVTDALDVITPDGESFLIWSLALIGGIKEESDQVVTYARQMESARKRLEKWAQNRSLHTPKRRYTSDPADFRRDPADWRY